jgi:heme O synthase-like polyprenyltransferase
VSKPLLKAYYQLAKPGIIYGNAVNALAGFFLAAAGDISWLLLLAVMAGTSLVIASGCVFNNYIDQALADQPWFTLLCWAWLALLYWHFGQTH